MVALALAVGACQGMEEPRQSSVVDAEGSLIRFKHPDFEGDPGHYTVERESRSGNELHTARFLGPDAVALLAAYKTSASYVVRERAVEAYIAQLMEDEEIDWGETGRAVAPLGIVPYRLFELVDRRLSCVGFGLTLGATSDDRGRNSDLMVGYFCHDGSRPMSTEAAEDLIGKVSLAGRS